MLLDVTIPHGCLTGDSFLVTVPDGSSLEVLVPKGMASGDVLTVEAQSPFGRPHAQPAATEVLEVIVPSGVCEGHSFCVETAWGGVFDVVVPSGCVPGDVIIVELPAAPPDEVTHTGGPAEWQCSDHAQWGASEQPEAPDEPCDWSSDHRYRSGSEVQVLRSDGHTYSHGTIVGSFEGVFEVLYTVRLANGLVKQAVPESEMFDARAIDDNYGAHMAAMLAMMMESEALDAQMGGCLMDD